MKRPYLSAFAFVLLLTLIFAVPVGADHGPDDGGEDGGVDELHLREDASASLIIHDAATADIISSGPFADNTKNIDARGIGARDVDGATTDVWALDGYAYTGTFNNPCGGDPNAGVWVWDVSNANKVEFVTVIPSPTGSRSNDVRAASMNSGDILVHSNEVCGAAGPGGFEVWNVDDPTAPVHLASVQTDDVNAFLRVNLGFVDFGVHNLFLFSQGGNDYVAATVESEFGNFQIFDLDDLGSGPVGFWGAESIGPADSPFPSPHPTEDYADAFRFRQNPRCRRVSVRWLRRIEEPVPSRRHDLCRWHQGLSSQLGRRARLAGHQRRGPTRPSFLWRSIQITARLTARSTVTPCGRAKTARSSLRAKRTSRSSRVRHRSWAHFNS